MPWKLFGKKCGYKMKKPKKITNDTAWEIFSKLLNEVDTPESGKDLEKELEELSKGQRAIFSLMWLETEVNNGGFSQFLSNSTGILTQEAMDGAVLISAPNHMKILTEVSNIFSGNVPLDRKEREEQLDALEEDKKIVLLLENLGHQFCSIKGEDYLGNLLTQYISKNPDEFFD